MRKTIDETQIPKRYGGKGELPIKMGYAADVEDALIDGDYAAQGDPIDVETVHCRRNAGRESKEKEADDAKEEQAAEQGQDKDVEEKEEKADAEEDGYVKVAKGNGITDDSAAKAQETEA